MYLVEWHKQINKKIVVLKIKKNDTNCGGSSKKKKAMYASIENKVEEILANKEQEKRGESVTYDHISNYIMSVMATGPRPSPQFHLTI